MGHSSGDLGGVSVCVRPGGSKEPCNATAPTNLTDCRNRFAGAFEARDVCVRFQDNSTARPHLYSRAGSCGNIFGFSEYKHSFRYVTRLQPADKAALQDCRQRRLGLGLRYSNDNPFHQQFFAAALHSALVAHAAPDALPVPIGSSFPRARPSPLWEYTLRSLFNTSAQRLNSEVDQLLQAPCTCFDRLVSFTGGFAQADVRSRDSVWAFRRASVRNARAAAASASWLSAVDADARDILFLLRRGRRRVIVNEDALLGEALAGQPRLRRVSFEGDVPVVEQMLIVSTAAVLIGVHGAGLSGYVTFLPSHLRKTACIEIRPRSFGNAGDWKPIVQNLARVAGVRFFALDAEHAPGCKADVHQSRLRSCTAGEAGSHCRRSVNRGASHAGACASFSPTRL